MKLNDILKPGKDDGASLFDERSRAIRAHKLMQWAKVATFGLYIVAVFMLYVADVWGIGSFIEKNSNEFVALIIFSFISFVLAYFLASSKEAVYEDIALHRAEGWNLTGGQKFAMVLFLSSGVLFEMFSTTNNQQHIANTAAEQSSMMKSIQGTDVSIIGGSGDAVQAATVRMASCQKKLAQGKVKDCVESQANLDAANSVFAQSGKLAQDASKQAMDNKVEGMLKIREHFDKPMFQAIGKATGTDNNSGMLMVIGVLIFIFELQHILAMFAYSNALRRLKTAPAESKPQPAGNGYGVALTPSPAPSASPVTPFQAMKAEFKSVVDNAPAKIASEFNQAQQARQQFYSKSADKLDSIQDDLNKHAAFLKLLVMEAQASVNHGMEPTHANVKSLIAHVLKRHQQTTGQNTQHVDLDKLSGLVLGKIKPAADISQASPGKTYRAELREGEKAYSDSPLDKPRPAPLGNGNADYPDRMPLPAMIQRIHADVLASGVKTRGEVLDAVKAAYLQLPNPTPMTGAQLATVAGKISDKLDSTVSMPEPKPHGTGRYNPVLGTAEGQHEMPLPTVHAQHAQTRPSTVHAQTHSHAQPEQARTAGHAQPEQPVTTVHAQSEQPRTDAQTETVHAQPELTAAARQVEADLYPEWIGQVSAKAITAGARDAKRFISQATFTHGDKTVLAVQEMGRIWLNWQDRAANDGVLKPNPKYQPGNRQPKYLLA